MKLASSRKFIFALLVLYLVYMGIFVYSASFTINGERYFCLFDDAMISMRYARNLIEGYGLTWNPGEKPVEGFTNPLWLLIMAILHLLPLSISKVSLAVQVLAIFILLVNIIVVYLITKYLSEGSSIAGFIASFFTAFYYPLNHWGILGMEVSLLTLLINSVVLLAIRGIISSKLSILFFLLIGIIPLVRIDGVIPVIIVLAFTVLSDKKINWKRTFIYGISVIGIAFVIQETFRYVYYGDIFPNTYYLKMTGYPATYRLARGFITTTKSLYQLLLIFPFIIIYARRFHSHKLLLLPLLIFWSQICYNIYVGGDAWEFWNEANRFISIVMPMMFIFLSVVIKLIYDQNKVYIQTLLTWKKRFLIIFSSIVLILIFLSVNKRGEWKNLKELALLNKPHHVEEHKIVFKQALALKELVNDSTTVAVVWAGVIPYVINCKCIDILGKNDKYIARLPMRFEGEKLTYTSFYPGHMKYDYNYSIGKLKPDIVASLWHAKEEALKIMRNIYCWVKIENSIFLLRKGSKNIKWEKLSVPLNELRPEQNSNIYSSE